MSTPTILEKIKAYKLEEIAADKAQVSLDELENMARNADPVRPFAEALELASKQGYGLIAEIKKASPSKGLIREDFDPATLAEAYAEGGATCLSVLTDTPSFQGAKSFLTEARAACDLPALRKDFMYDPYQVVEARSLNADCILIIMGSVSDEQAAELEAAAQEWGMDALLEVHNAEELERATRLNSRMIGINNRDLHTFREDLGTTERVRRYVPGGVAVVAASGVRSFRGMERMKQAKVNAVLIGEALAVADDIPAKFAELQTGQSQ